MRPRNRNGRRWSPGACRSKTRAQAPKMHKRRHWPPMDGQAGARRGLPPWPVCAAEHMHEQEPSMQAATSIDGDLMQFIIAAFNASRIALYRPFLNEQEYAHLTALWQALGRMAGADRRRARRHRYTRAAHRPGRATAARLWLDLFRSYAGTDTATQLKFRQAHQQEPRLMEGSFVDSGHAAISWYGDGRGGAGVSPGEELDVRHSLGRGHVGIGPSPTRGTHRCAAFCLLA